MEHRLRDKFRGCMMGALVGDCIGTLFESDYSVSYSILGDLYLSLTNLSEDEKLMDLHGIDFTLGPRIAKELLERKRVSIVPMSKMASTPEDEDADIKQALGQNALKRHSSSYERRGSFSRPVEKFSDDTVMTRSVALSIIRMKGFDPRDMAIQMTEDYFLNLRRKFGAYTREIFTQLRNHEYADPYGPSKKAVGNLGSLGNEGATRVSPIALFLWRDDPYSVADMAGKVTKITNFHKNAVIGSACQALAIHTAFNWGLADTSTRNKNRRRSKLTLMPSPQTVRKSMNTNNDQENIPMNEMEFNHRGFCQKILDGISHMESRTSSLLENLKHLMHTNKETLDHSGESAYTAKIQTIIEFMQRPEVPPRAEVVEKLGNRFRAVESVPSALFSFLIAASSVNFSELPVQIKSPVLKSIFYAISLGGDSDTTASMAGAIAGAYWGYECIPQEIIRVCEGSREVLKLADELFRHCQNQNDQ